MNIFDHFNPTYHPHWTQVTTGGGKLEIIDSALKMSFASANWKTYTDAQIDDYTMLSKADYLWNPPLRMAVRSRFSHSFSSKKTTSRNNTLRGTAGFGFWNRPFTMQGDFFTLPEAIWFLYSAPPSNMALAQGIPGWGWKAQVVHTTFVNLVTNAIPLALSIGYAKLSGNQSHASRWLQRLSGARESLIQVDMTKWHTYTLEWKVKSARFWVDNKEILKVRHSPTRPLGFVAWLDNEYAVVTPTGELRFGKTSSGPQWLEVDYIKIDQL